MKNKIIRSFFVLVCVAFAVCVMPAVSYAATPDSGKAGTCDWEIDAEGVLTISAGELATAYVCPWQADRRAGATQAEIELAQRLRQDITKVVFNGSVVADRYSNHLFQDCVGLTTIDNPESFDTSNVELMDNMFRGCTSLGKVSATNPDGLVDLASWDVSNVKNFTYMFYDCTSMQEIDIRGWDTRNADSTAYMFGTRLKGQCSNLKRIILGEEFKNIHNFNPDNAAHHVAVFPTNMLEINNGAPENYQYGYLDEKGWGEIIPNYEGGETYANGVLQYNYSPKPGSPVLNGIRDYRQGAAVVLDENNGTGATTPLVAYYKSGSLLTLPADPIRAGYKFLGYNTMQDGSGTFVSVPAGQTFDYAQLAELVRTLSFPDGVAILNRPQSAYGPITLYAQWEQNASGGNTGGNEGGNEGGNTATPSASSQTAVPKTGDSSNIIFWIAFLFISCGTAATVRFVSKKRVRS